MPDSKLEVLHSFKEAERRNEMRVMSPDERMALIEELRVHGWPRTTPRR